MILAPGLGANDLGLLKTTSTLMARPQNFPDRPILFSLYHAVIIFKGDTFAKYLVRKEFLKLAMRGVTPSIKQRLF